jgi:hypothetical protein
MNDSQIFKGSFKSDLGATLLSNNADQMVLNHRYTTDEFISANYNFDKTNDSKALNTLRNNQPESQRNRISLLTSPIPL